MPWCRPTRPTHFAVGVQVGVEPHAAAAGGHDSGFWRVARVILRECQHEVEHAVFVGRLLGSHDQRVDEKGVGVVGAHDDARQRRRHQLGNVAVDAAQALGRRLSVLGHVQRVPPRLQRAGSATSSASGAGAAQRKHGAAAAPAESLAAAALVSASRRSARAIEIAPRVKWNLARWPVEPTGMDEARCCRVPWPGRPRDAAPWAACGRREVARAPAGAVKCPRGQLHDEGPKTRIADLQLTARRDITQPTGIDI